MRTTHFPVSSWPRLFPILAAASLLLSSGCFRTESNPTGNVPEPNAGFPSAKIMNAKLGRGLNLGNALDAPKEGDWGVTLKPEWFRMIADSGFATVRIPVRWSSHAQTAPPYTIDSAFMARVAWAVDQALAAKLNVVLDVHHYDSLYAHPDVEKERFLSIWRQICGRFGAYPPELLFEILNEPRDQLDATAWNRLLGETLDSIRALQPHRSLIVGTAPWGSLSGLAALQLPPDTNLIVTVHYYDPHTFTHQGAIFEPGASAWLGTRWRATPTQRAQVDQDIKAIRDWAAVNDRPIFMGEFGTYEAVDSASRALYTEYLAAGFSQAGFSWALWNFTSDFGVWNDSAGVWRRYLLDALLHPGHNAYLDSVEKAVKPIDLGKYFIFDDFEDSLGNIPVSAVAWQHKVGKSGDSSHSFWYVYYSDSSRITNGSGERLSQWFEVDSGTAPRNFAHAEGPWGYQGRGLHMKVRLTGSPYPYAGFGAGLLGGWDSSYVDLSKLTAIQFRAKGRGEWVLQIVSDSINNRYPVKDNWGQMVAPFTLKDQWESFVLPAELFAPKPYSVQAAQGLRWEDVRKKIIALEFMNGQSYGQSPDDSLEIWVDDIRLIGVDKTDFGL